MIIKQRAGAGKIARMDLVGSVEGKEVIIIDDIIDTAGTLCKAGEELKKFGAKAVHAFATHGLFNGDAFDNIKKSQLKTVVVTNTVPARPGEESIDSIVRLSISSLLAEVIYRVQTNLSISDLFKQKHSGH